MPGAKKVSAAAAAAFMVTLLLCATVIGTAIFNKDHIEKITMEQIITEKGISVNETIGRLLYKTQTLSALVIKNDGSTEDFSKIAAILLDDPSILNVLIAPDGVVTDVYPALGNEAVLNLDFFAEGLGNKEAILARDTGRLVFGGPFELVQGGQALVGRLPVFLDAPDGGKQFWGLVSVTLKYPEVLDRTGLVNLASQGYHYEIWRISPDTGERQSIADSSSAGLNARYIEKCILVQGTEWYFRIAPIRQWFHYPESWIMIFAGLIVSFLVALTLQNNFALKLTKVHLERMTRTDSLTGIFNRKHFMELAGINMEKNRREDAGCYIVLFDLDKFKMINDQYGHLTGDTALITVADTIKGLIRPYDLFARYGGEEFIIMMTGIDDETAAKVVERMRGGLEETPVVTKEARLTVTASFGIARARPEDNLSAVIKRADKAMYQAKDAGRNTACFAK